MNHDTSGENTVSNDTRDPGLIDAESGGEQNQDATAMTEAPKPTDPVDESRTPQETPAREDSHALVVVGLGGSAGGMAAVETFLQSVPTAESGIGNDDVGDYNPGTAYVVVLHLSPEHESNLAEILSRSTSMPVRQVTEPVDLEAGNVYVIPPGKSLEMQDGRLRPVELEPTPGGSRSVIDTFFRTLAEDRGPQSVAVVLSGTGADGTLGLRKIKEVGGLAIAQSPGEAEFDAMPRSAITRGMVDYVLPAAAIPAQIAAYWNTSRRMRLPAEAAPSPEQRAEGAVQEDAVRNILGHVRDQTGHDFALYKRATVLRRIGRRMQINGRLTLPEYHDFLRFHPAEVGDLVSDMLISVTQFFRDPDAWEALSQNVLARLFHGRETQDEVRVWVCGCATGEEAYTLAMLLLERAESLEKSPRIQIFATDMDAEAIARARTGVYPETIAADVSEERLRRWFYRQNGMYQVRKEVREIVLFATHDVLRDTPFSRLDLITCRNLLIYLNREAQERIFQTFHFALRPDGRMFLGPSESADTAANLFGILDKQHRIYVRRPVARTATPQVPVTATAFSSRSLLPLPRTVAAPSLTPPASPQPFGGAAEAPPATAAGGRDLMRLLLERYGPPTALINEAHDVVHLSNGAGQFLHVADGELTRNLLRLVHPSLRIELRTALYAASKESADQARLTRATLIEGQPPAMVRMTVRPVDAPEAARGYFLVQFEQLTEGVFPSGDGTGATATPVSPVVQSSSETARQLEEEIAKLQGELSSTIEQYEALTEELKASNEELQAMNEEQRSAGEELETSREELQSVNEELTTVNHELKARVEEVTRTNSDLQNFLASTDIGTLFLDRELRIKRYTPAAEELFNLIPTDAGRPIAHVTNRLDYPSLAEDARIVLARLAPVEREVVSNDDQRRFLARLLPYRTLDDRIDGVVINFVDITQRTRAEAALRESEERLRLVIESVNDYAIFTLDPRRHVTSWNPGAQTMFGYTQREILGQSGDTLFTPEDRQKGDPEHEAQIALENGRAENERFHARKDGSRFYASGVTTPLYNPDGDLLGFVKIMRDLTERKEAEEALRESEERLRIAVDAAEMATWDWNLETGEVLWNERHFLLFGMEPRPNPISASLFVDHVHEQDRPWVVERLENAVAQHRVFEAEFRIHRENGEVGWMEGYGRIVETVNGKATRMCGVMSDITERKKAEELLRESEQRLRVLIENLPGGAAFIVDRDLRYLLAAGEALQDANVTPENFVGKTVSEALDPERAARTEQAYRRALGGEPFTEEHEDYGRSYLSRGTPLRDANQNTYAVLVVSYDISDFKQAEAARREFEERFRLLVEGARDYAMFLLNAQGRITFWSTGADRVFGWTEDEAVGRTVEFLFTPEDRERGEPEQEQQTAATQGRAIDRRWHLRKDGSRFWADGILMRLDDEAGRLRGFAKIARDATDQKQAEEAIREALEAVARANEELEHRVEERTRSLAERTDELAEMSGMRQELLRQVVTAQEQERARISRDLHDDTGQQVTALLLGLNNLKNDPALTGQSETQDLISLLQSLAGDVAQKSHRLSFTLRPTALDDTGLMGALQNYIEEWMRWSRTPAELESVGMEGVERLPGEIETTIYRVVQEALTNILKHAVPAYSEELGDEAVVAPRVSVVVQRGAREVVTTIEDDGPGFDVEAVLNQPPGKRRLGIFGMQERARLAGGTLSIESKPGEGTTVFLRLPLA